MGEEEELESLKQSLRVCQDSKDIPSCVELSLKRSIANKILSMELAEEPYKMCSRLKEGEQVVVPVVIKRNRVLVDCGNCNFEWRLNEPRLKTE